MDFLMQSDIALPLIFAGLMGLSMLIYAILDGYDLGVGILTAFAKETEKDIMIASIGPFWDANETWLVLGVGILLVAFPFAHGVILTELYIPVALMLFGLIFRGVAFDFRAKVPKEKKHWWNLAFFGGSLLTALSQGAMLGDYIMGFKSGFGQTMFAILVAAVVAVAYGLIGACWLIYKTQDELQIKAVQWAKIMLGLTLIGIAAISIATPLTSERIFYKWFALPDIIFLAPIPLTTGALALLMFMLLKHMPLAQDRYAYAPFMIAILIATLCFFGLAFSFYPYIVPEKLTIVDAASAPESLMIILVGTLFILPILIGYTALAYYIFRGKARELRYD